MTQYKLQGIKNVTIKGVQIGNIYIKGEKVWQRNTPYGYFKQTISNAGMFVDSIPKKCILTFISDKGIYTYITGNIPYGVRVNINTNLTIAINDYTSTHNELMYDIRDNATYRLYIKEVN